MIYGRGTAGEKIDRGRFVVPCECGAHYLADHSMRGRGGVARKPYSEWPPVPIQPGEEFEYASEGQIISLIGDKPWGVPLRDGRVDIPSMPGASLGEFRMLMAQAGYPLP